MGKVSNDKKQDQQHLETPEKTMAGGSDFHSNPFWSTPFHNPQLQPIQAKMEVGQSNDKHEKEADKIADSVMGSGNPPSISNLGDTIQQSGEGGGTASPKLENQINGSKGNGQSLSNDVQKEMGNKIGSDFSNVNVHTDNNAIQMNKELGAKAFTHGNDIYFNQGNFSPNSQDGKHLLAHELTHTVQQGGNNNGVQTKIQKEDDDLKSVWFTGISELEKAYDGKLEFGEGSAGVYVKRIQLAILELKGAWAVSPSANFGAGIDLGKDGADGIFGGKTKDSLAFVQEVKGMKNAKGIVGQETMKFLDGYFANTPFEDPLGNMVSPSPDLEYVEGQIELMAYEFIAHDLSYRHITTKENNSVLDERDAQILKPRDLKILQKAGYLLTPDYGEEMESSKLIKGDILWFRGQLGLQLLYIRGGTNKVNDILSVRGTDPVSVDPHDALTAYADADPVAVGMSQTTNPDNAQMLKDYFSVADGKTDITGHSLGGAVAQLITAEYGSQVGTLITFQAPGIDQASVNKYNKIAEENRPEVIHNIILGDVVDKAGEANIPGTTYEHDIGLTQTKPADLVKELIEHLTEISKQLKPTLESLENLSSAYGQTLGTMNPFSIPALADANEVFGKNAALLYIEVLEFKNYIMPIGETVGKGHTSFIYSNKDDKSKFDIETFDQLTEQRGDVDTNSTGTRASIQESFGHDVTETDIYPHADWRLTAESVRKDVGAYIDKYFTQDEMIDLFTKLDLIFSKKKMLDVYWELNWFGEYAYCIAEMVGIALILKNTYLDELVAMIADLQSVYQELSK
jgi:hypothetical protein